MAATDNLNDQQFAGTKLPGVISLDEVKKRATDDTMHPDVTPKWKSK